MYLLKYFMPFHSFSVNLSYSGAWITSLPLYYDDPIDQCLTYFQMLSPSSRTSLDWRIFLWLPWSPSFLSSIYVQSMLFFRSFPSTLMRIYVARPEIRRTTHNRQEPTRCQKLGIWQKRIGQTLLHITRSKIDKTSKHTIRKEKQNFFIDLKIKKLVMQITAPPANKKQVEKSLWILQKMSNPNPKMRQQHPKIMFFTLSDPYQPNSFRRQILFFRYICKDTLTKAITKAITDTAIYILPVPLSRLNIENPQFANTDKLRNILKRKLNKFILLIYWQYLVQGGSIIRQIKVQIAQRIGILQELVITLPRIWQTSLFWSANVILYSHQIPNFAMTFILFSNRAIN